MRDFAANHEDTLAGAARSVARNLAAAPVQVALRWVLDQRFITSAIVGARNARRFADIAAGRGVAAAGRRTRERLDKVSFLPHRYPRSMEDRMEERRNAAVKRG